MLDTVSTLNDSSPGPNIASPSSTTSPLGGSPERKGVVGLITAMKGVKGKQRQRGFFQERLQRLVDRAATIRVHEHPLPLTDLHNLVMWEHEKGEDDDAEPEAGSQSPRPKLPAIPEPRERGSVGSAASGASSAEEEASPPASPRLTVPPPPDEVPKEEGVRYRYGGAGSYVCRLCLKLKYGSAHHCAVCVPVYDICEPCFTECKVQEVGERDPAVDGEESGGASPTYSEGSSGSSITVDPFENISTAWLVGRSGVTAQEALQDAIRGEFAGLLNVLFPPESQSALVSKQSKNAPAAKFEMTIRCDLTHRTLLHLAADAGADRVVLGLLMYLPAELVNAPDSNGLTPLMTACLRGRESVVEELLYKDDVALDVRCHRGYTALMLAASRGHGSITSRLIFRGACVDLVSRDGRTALSIASLNGWADCARLILQSGADPEVPDREGYTAIVLAAAKGHMNVVSKFPTALQDRLRW
eukprot:TRINITY_DN3432_c0_g1_i1.p1 TRINITY_DN3432_c0_g1~~TRINITY_DN3432_c0_g1_i1.p1  ORF type:complete len:473 (+),score=130.67 TRINITY_DN3432_c0_g1_i1:72-1490(+)